MGIFLTDIIGCDRIKLYLKMYSPQQNEILGMLPYIFFK